MNPQEQVKKQDKAPQIAPYRFKKGVSGNPGGRVKGSKSMKVWAREYLQSLDEDERIEFLGTLPTSLIWQMAEGNPENKSDIKLDVNNKYTEEEIEAAKQFIVNRLNSNKGSTDVGGTETNT